jgi:hypothetical protein
MEVIRIRNNFRKPHYKKINERFRRRCEDNIKTDITDMYHEDADWIYVVQNKIRWSAVVNRLRNVLKGWELSHLFE